MAHCQNKCAPFDLDFWDSNPKLTGDPLLSSWCVDRNEGGLVKALSSLFILIGNVLSTIDQSDIDIWFSDHQIKKFPLLPMMDMWTRYEEGRSRCSWVKIRKRCWHICPRWPWPLTQWPQISRIPLDVWTKLEDGRSIRSLVIARKGKGYRRTDRRVQSNTPSLLPRVGA